MQTKRAILMSWVLVLGCGPQDQEAEARASNLSAVDGCGWIVELGGRSYAPDQASKELLNSHHTAVLEHIRVTYHLTGRAGKVLCGLAGTEVRLPEIVLTSLVVP